MLDFKIVKDKKTQEEWIETSLTGKLLLNIPQLNKGTAFTAEERHTFGLLGKLPAHIETLEEQVQRARWQYQAYDTALQKNIYLNNLHDKNQVLFFKLVGGCLAEFFPVIYTPIVGAAVKEHSREFRQARGLYISYADRAYIGEILDNRSHPEIDLIVVTDGERILGIGDQGVGGMDIPIAKLMVYTLCAGINPLRTLPIMLDVGTNNQNLLDDPLYLGLRQKRVMGEAYDDFIAQFVNEVKKRFPNVFLHWEDFARQNARKNLLRFQNEICSFNDDIQGTGVVTLAALLAAVKANQTSLKEQRIVMFGAGSAGAGIVDQICAAMMHEGLTEQEARQRFWLVDRQGLLLSNMSDLMPAQKPYARDPSEIKVWKNNKEEGIKLFDVIRHVQPTVLIGCSAQRDAFDQTIVQEMAKHVTHPIIFPLSNPHENCEAQPKDLLQWTNGKALVATGSPFDPVEFNGRKIVIAQCNNALAFPGIGLGVLAVRAKRLTEDMLWVACQALSDAAPVLQDKTAPLLPPLETAREIAHKIALAVAKQACETHLATEEPCHDIAAHINEMMWSPRYLPFRLALRQSLL